MFSSNQEFKISGNFNQLQLALDFAIQYDETNEKHIVFQTTEDGKYCIGWALDGHPYKGWKSFQFDYDSEIVAKIIIQYLSKQEYKTLSEEVYFDGGTDKGFLMKLIPKTFLEEQDGIKSPFYGIVSFETFTNFYSK